MLQGPYGDPDQGRLLIRLPFKIFAVVTVLLPATGFIACIIVSLIYHYEDTAHAHCKVNVEARRRQQEARFSAQTLKKITQSVFYFEIRSSKTF